MGRKDLTNIGRYEPHGFTATGPQWQEEETRVLGGLVACANISIPSRAPKRSYLCLNGGSLSKALSSQQISVPPACYLGAEQGPAGADPLAYTHFVGNLDGGVRSNEGRIFGNMQPSTHPAQK